jgi:hypothetical protein
MGDFYLDLFTAETWDEFTKAGGEITGFRTSRWARVKKIKPGAVLLCYLVGVKRWVGVLKVTGDPFQSPEPKIWESDDFPSRLPVKIIHRLSAETGVPVHDLIPEMPMFEKVKGKSTGAWGAFFLGSPQSWPAHDAQIVVEAIREAEANPVAKPLPKGAKVAAQVVEAPKIGLVAVPTADEEDEGLEAQESPQPSEHTEIQARLIELGHAMGYSVFVAKNDRNRDWNGTKLCDLPGVTNTLPNTFNPATIKVIELIDVLWLSDNAIAGAFEVEKSTSIYSGLLRMADLIVMQPNIDIPIFLVAPDERREKVKYEVNRPTFSAIRPKKPLVQTCRYISFDTLREAMDKHGPLLEYLTMLWMEKDLSESCAVSEA